MIESVLKRNGYNSVYDYIHGGKELNYKFKTVERKMIKKDKKKIIIMNQLKFLVEMMINILHSK